MKKLFTIFALCTIALAINAQGYVDLGLLSGTLWKTENEKGYYKYYSTSQFGNNMPTKDQWDELVSSCKWTWKGVGYDILGPNGNSIFLPAAGYQDDNGIHSMGEKGIYWSSTPYNHDYVNSAWAIEFSSKGVRISDWWRYFCHSIRLVSTMEQEREREQERELVRQAELAWQQREQQKQKLIDSLSQLNDFVDLGLPSGLLWKAQSEPRRYTYNEAYLVFGENLPTEEHFQELIDNCKWTKLDHYWVATGPNGNKILMRFSYHSATLSEINETKSIDMTTYMNAKSPIMETASKDKQDNVLLVKRANDESLPEKMIPTGTFVDLGLSSGTLWADQDTACKCRRTEYQREINGVPTKEQWLELKKECKWEWKKYGYKVIGPNGKYIYLPLRDQLYYKKGWGPGYYFHDVLYYAYCMDKDICALNITPKGKFRFFTRKNMPSKVDTDRFNVSWRKVK